MYPESAVSLGSMYSRMGNAVALLANLGDDDIDFPVFLLMQAERRKKIVRLAFWPSRGVCGAACVPPEARSPQRASPCTVRWKN